MLAKRIPQQSTASLTRVVTSYRPYADRLVSARAEEKPTQRTVETDGAPSEWEAIDGRIREQVYSDDWEDTLPLPFIAAVSTFGTALTGVLQPRLVKFNNKNPLSFDVVRAATWELYFIELFVGYLTWSKLTNAPVVCPVAGCSSILDSPYSQIGPAPLSALGLLAYGSVAFLSFCSIALKSQRDQEAVGPGMWLSRAQQGILYGSSVLAGTSIALAFTLKAKFAGEWCAYCAASIAASLTLYGVTFANMQDGRKNLSFGSVVATTLLITGLYTTYPDTVTARSEIPFTDPVVTQMSPDGALTLAQSLKDKGAKMYGAFWCSHCFEQKQAFGKDAVGVLPYVECYPDGYSGPKSINRACVDADVQGFPTWIINGQKVEGDWPLPYLQSVLDGADPRQEAKKYD